MTRGSGGSRGDPACQGLWILSTARPALLRDPSRLRDAGAGPWDGGRGVPGGPGRGGPERGVPACDGGGGVPGSGTPTGTAHRLSRL